MSIIEIHKNSQSIIRLGHREYKKKIFIDIREYFLADDNSWMPTAKGVTFAPEKLPELIDALKRVNDDQ